ncbi:nuclear transport factor 2 family protein [Streptomyces sp. NPDC088812]|uniref:nuclear transport factor 2 family protein n=1 Tax=Streptomyces sp. NPDC088812 TaxID=3365905 RepID=UPI0038266A07
MAEHPHALLVRKGYDAFMRGDMDSLRAMMTGDCTHHVPGSHPLSGDHKGIDSIIDGYYRRLFSDTDGSFRVALLNVFVDGRGHAVSVHRVTADRGAGHIDGNGGIVFRIVGEKITDLDECVEDMDKSDAFWS